MFDLLDALEICGIRDTVISCFADTSSSRVRYDGSVDRDLGEID